MQGIKLVKVKESNMKAILIKTPEQLYKLKFYNDEDMLACATALLSKKNCDEIFGVEMGVSNVCIECLAEDYSKLTVFFMPDSDEVPTAKQILEYEKISEIAYKAGLIKGLKLNKDMVFTFEDMKGYFDWHKKQGYVSHKPEDMDEYIQSLQQPTEIEVEIEMREDYLMWKHSDIEKMSDCLVPKLDSEGYLILKKI